MATTTNAYAVDLGFDWNAALCGNVYPLQYGILSKGTSGQENDTPITPFQFAGVSANVDDTIYFWVNDISDMSVTNSALDPKAVSITVTLAFKNVDNGTSQVVLDPSPATNMSAPYSQNSYSTVFQATVPRYAVGGSTPQIYTFDTETGLVTNLTVTVNVTYTPQEGQSTTKTFVLDPEMVIGASNSGNPDPDGSKTPTKQGH